MSDKNPLLIRTVIRCLYDNVRGSDRLRFRLVCREWNNVATILMPKHMQVVYQPSRLENFMDEFETRYPSIRFSAFSITQWSSSKFPEGAVDRFLQRQRNNIKQLRLENIDSVNWQLLNCCQITELCLSSELKYTIRIGLFPNLKALCLSNCNVELSSENVKPFPTKIELILVKFVYDNVTSDNEPLHQFLDVSKCTEIKLSRVDCSLDMSALPPKLNYVVLDAIEVDNLEMSTNTVQLLHLQNFVNFDISNLDLQQAIFFQCRVDLLLLPPSLKAIDFHAKCDLSCSNSLFLPNLEHVGIDVHQNDALIITCFKNCERLVSLDLHALTFDGWLTENAPSMKWDFDMCLIPSSVKMLKTRSNMMLLSPTSSKIDLEVLILTNTELPMVLKILQHVESKKLILYYDYTIFKIFDWIDFLGKTESINELYVGSFSSYDGEIFFDKHPLSTIVDKHSNFYKFVNGRGFALSTYEFHSLQYLYYFQECPSSLNDYIL